QGHRDAPATFDPQDMRNMGGLAGKMKITFWVYLVGALALAGVFPLAGFWSKDEILADAFHVGFAEGAWHGTAVYLLLTVAAFFTAFYMGRQVFMVFFGEGRSGGGRVVHFSQPQVVRGRAVRPADRPALRASGLVCGRGTGWALLARLVSRYHHRARLPRPYRGALAGRGRGLY
ncbi:MAG: hypothetical protein HY784_03500, partial [Chloroflexi bacterium]|nr:hypothetical protein [Chloroflexota bacterium]